MAGLASSITGACVAVALMSSAAVASTPLPPSKAGTPPTVTGDHVAASVAPAPSSAAKADDQSMPGFWYLFWHPHAAQRAAAAPHKMVHRSFRPIQTVALAAPATVWGRHVPVVTAQDLRFSACDSLLCSNYTMIGIGF